VARSAAARRRDVGVRGILQRPRRRGRARRSERRRRGRRGRRRGGSAADRRLWLGDARLAARDGHGRDRRLRAGRLLVADRRRVEPRRRRDGDDGAGGFGLRRAGVSRALRDPGSRPARRGDGGALLPGGRSGDQRPDRDVGPRHVRIHGRLRAVGGRHRGRRGGEPDLQRPRHGGGRAGLPGHERPGRARRLPAPVRGARADGGGVAGREPRAGAFGRGRGVRRGPRPVAHAALGRLGGRLRGGVVRPLRAAVRARADGAGRRRGGPAAGRDGAGAMSA
jgi:hypothetical protein